MASVYHLFSNITSFPYELIQENERLEGPARTRYIAAIVLQRTWRGYRARKMIKYWAEQATIIQKNFRGWITRWHKVDFLQDYLKRIEQRDLNNNATKIQSAWRGYLVRRNMKMSIKAVVQMKKNLKVASSDMRDLIREKFRNMKSGIAGFSKEDKERIGEECKRWVLYILFKTRHLLRTQCREGVYSIHNSDKLSQIEKWMKTLPMKKYMNDLRKLYNEKCKEEDVIQYIFSDLKYRKYEYLYRTRDRSHEDKPTKIVDKNIHDEPFDLYKRPEQEAYDRKLLYEDPYQREDNLLLRTFSQYSSDFDLFVHQHPNIPPSVPPYYIDFWAPKCNIHDLDN